jgi:hypothetical protein
MKAYSLELLSCLCLVFILNSCKDTEPEPTPTPVTPPKLEAKAGADLLGGVSTLVLLDGSASTGPSGFSFEWTYTDTTIPETEINFQDKNTAKPSFTPPVNGEYNFKLKVTSGAETSEDAVKVTVTGVKVIGGQLTNGYIFTDIEPDPAKADYKVTSNLKIINAGEQSLEGIVFEFAEGTALEFQGFARLTGGRFTSQTHWKGILLNNGVDFGLDNAVIENAGTGLHAGQTESAAITNAIAVLKLTNTKFIGTTGYDVLSPYRVTLHHNTFSSAKPVKLNASFLADITGNTYPENYDYITVTSYGHDEFVGAPRVVFEAMNYYISDELNVANALIIAPGATLMMKEGVGIYSDDSVIMKGTAEKPITIKGFDGAPWKGLALLSWQIVDIDHLILSDAGAMNFDFEYFTSDVPAAIHVEAKVSIKNSDITSAGYGISFATDGHYSNYTAPNTVVANNTIHSGAPSMRIDFTRVGKYLPEGHNNLFDPPAGVGAIEIVNYDTDYNAEPQVWYPPADNQFYLVNADIVIFPSPLTLKPGVVLKFKAGKSLVTPVPSQDGAYYPGLYLTAIGTPDKHIVFDSEAGTPGTWGGLSLNEKFDLEYCEIKNGGEIITTGATEKANLTIRSFVGENIYYFSNNIVSGSAGYGIVLEDGAPNKDVDFPPANNVYSNNASGNLKFK